MKNDKNELASIRQKTHNQVDNVMDKAERVGEGGKEMFVRFKNKAMLARKNADVYISKNPEKSVLIAAGVGAVIGSIITALLMRKKH